MKNKIIQDRYRYVINHWNNLIQNGRDNELTSKYFYKGLDLLHEHNPLFCDRLEYLHKGFLEKKAKQILILSLLALFIPQLTPFIKIKFVGVAG